MTPRNRTGSGRRAKATGRAGSKREETPPEPAKVDELAQQHAAAAIEALAAVMRDDSASPAARISAAATLLQWGFGKTGPANKANPPDEPSGHKAEYLIRLSWGSPPGEEDVATD